MAKIEFEKKRSFSLISFEDFSQPCHVFSTSAIESESGSPINLNCMNV